MMKVLPIFWVTYRPSLFYEEHCLIERFVWLGTNERAAVAWRYQ